MSTSEISSTQQAISTSPIETQSSNTTTITDGANTGIGAYSNDKHLDTSSYVAKTASVLQNTYFFNPDEARQISAFAEAVKDAEPKFYVDVKPGFLDKIKALCAKILGFFKNDSKKVQLRGDGIAVFDSLKKNLLKSKNKDFALRFIKQNAEVNNEEALRGFAHVVGFKLDENRDLSTQLEAFINIKYFDNLKDYTGENGKIIFLKKTLGDLSASENGQEKLKTFFEVFDKCSKYVSIDNQGFSTFECSSLASYFLYSAIFAPYKNNDTEGLKNMDKKILLFQALSGAQDMEIKHVSKLENLIAFAKTKPNILRNSEILSEFPELKESLEQEILSVQKAEKQTAYSKLWDLPVDISLSIRIQNETIEISLPKKGEDTPLPEGVASREEWAFSELQKSIEHLPNDQQEKVREFYKNFQIPPRAGNRPWKKTEHDPLHINVDILGDHYDATGESADFYFNKRRVSLKQEEGV